MTARVRYTHIVRALPTLFARARHRFKTTVTIASLVLVGALFSNALVRASVLSAIEKPRGNSSGNYIIRQFQTDAGLPENTVTALAQTPDGYIWCATFSGLARFD